MKTICGAGLIIGLLAAACLADTEPAAVIRAKEKCAIDQTLAMRTYYSAMATSEARTIKAGVSLADDLRALKKVFPFAEKNILDLGHVARRSGFEQTGVRNLAGILLGFRIPKGTKTSNWAARELSAAQIAYAATDAWACRELFLRFQGLGLLAAKAPAGL